MHSLRSYHRIVYSFDFVNMHFLNSIIPLLLCLLTIICFTLDNIETHMLNLSYSLSSSLFAGFHFLFHNSYGKLCLQIGNILVCIAVYANATMRTVTNIFIVNLAIADLLVIILCLPPTVIWDVTETWFLGEAMCKIILYLQVSFIIKSLFS